MTTPRFVYSLMAVSLTWALFSAPVQAQAQSPDTDVPVGQVEGTLLPPSEAQYGSKSELSPTELKTLGVDKGGVLQRGEVSAQVLPPIFITMESGTYEQVAVEVPVNRKSG